MANLRTKSDTPQAHQMNLFDYVQKLAAEKRKVTEGSLNVKERLRASLNAAIKQCNLSRHQIAGEMSHLLGADITRTQIDSWTAESKELNRIPAEYLPAFCRATGSIEPMRILAEAAGAFAMPGPARSGRRSRSCANSPAKSTPSCGSGRRLSLKWKPPNDERQPTDVE